MLFVVFAFSYLFNITIKIFKPNNSAAAVSINNFARLTNELLGEFEGVSSQALAALSEDERTDAEELKEMISTNLIKIQEHGKRADGIVNNMLAHSREGPGAAAPTELNRLLEDSLNLAYHGARAENQEFNVTIDRDFDAEVGEIEAFAQDLMRVFLNLIGNGFYAVKKRQSQTQDVEYTPQLRVSTKQCDDTVEIRVRDNGTGIPQHLVEKIFEPFFTTKPTGEGTGLGLSLTFETVVKQHHGHLDVDTKEDEYTEFLVRLPCRLNEASTKEAG